jgi:uncharacterized protein (DUF1778 family)
MKFMQAVTMPKAAKTTQLQIRISKADKQVLQRAAAHAGLDLSAYVLGRAISRSSAEFKLAVRAAERDEPRFALAELNALLSRFTAAELREAIAEGVPPTLPPFLANYIAAMVEMACAKRAVPVPSWTRAILPLSDPAFVSTLQSLRLHLLTHSPAPFRRRNIFIDSSIDAQV